MMPLVSKRTFLILKTIAEHGVADIYQINTAFDGLKEVSPEQFDSLEKRGWVERVGRTPSLQTLTRRRLTSQGVLLLAYAKGEQAEHKKHMARRR